MLKMLRFKSSVLIETRTVLDKLLGVTHLSNLTANG